jgi:hypothetical protein
VDGVKQHLADFAATFGVALDKTKVVVHLEVVAGQDVARLLFL